MKGIHIFSKRIDPKVNVIARLEFEITHMSFKIWIRKKKNKNDPISTIFDNTYYLYVDNILVNVRNKSAYCI